MTAKADPFGMTTKKAKARPGAKAKAKGGYGVGGKRTVVRVSHCEGLFASATLLGRAVREKIYL
jgi:lipid-binding SYLF domain-containing protein